MGGFTFLHAAFIYLMIVPLTVFFYFILSHKEKEEQFFSLEVLNRLQLNIKSLNNKTRNLFFLLATLAILVALAQPVLELEKVKVQTKSSDVMVALDISDSMLAQDIAPSRLKSAKQKILDMLEVKADERFGVMAFAKEAYLVAPLSFDHQALKFLLRQLNTNNLTEKGTDFQQLLFSANEMLSKNENKYLLILSDGGDQKDFSEEIKLAKEYGIKVFVLAVATKKGAPIKTKNGFIKYRGDILISKLNENIKSLALQTGGAYVEATTSSKDIKAMLAEIESHTKKKTLSEDEVRNYKQLFYYPLFLAIILFFVAITSLPRKKALGIAAAIVLSFVETTPLKASLFDFQLLKNAKDAYESRDYNRSAKLYGDYALRHNDMNALFNKADALYKLKDYKAAQKTFEKIVPQDRESEFKRDYNLGNSYAKEATKEALQKAIKAYEKALTIRKDDKNTEENLESVKKALEKLKQKKSQEKQNQEKNSKQKKSQEKQNQEKKDSNQQEQKQKSKKDSKKDASSKDTKEQDRKKEEKKSKQEQQKSEQKKEAQAKKDKEKSKQEQEKEQKKAENNSSVAVPHNLNEMSDKESKKQLMRIMKNRPGHLYQMRAMGSRKHKESSNEKPW